MIHYLKRHQIDVIKYDTCIELSTNSRIYAYSWYLDIVSDNWDALVLNDYEAIMPLPWRSKYFIKYIYPPAWTQQLGVFSKNEISNQLILDFIKAIPKKFKKVTIQFNSDNDLSLLKSTERVNYILPLNKSYEEIYEGFNTNRKRDLSKAIRSGLILDKEIYKNEFFNFYESSHKNYKLTTNQIVSLKLLLKVKNENIHIWGIYENEKLTTCLFWLKEDKRITYLLPVASTDAKDNGLPTFIVSELIRKFSNLNYILDFEGSMIEGVADFYKSFGAEEEDYFLLEKRFLFSKSFNFFRK